MFCSAVIVAATSPKPSTSCMLVESRHSFSFALYETVLRGKPGVCSEGCALALRAKAGPSENSLSCHSRGNNWNSATLGVLALLLLFSPPRFSPPAVTASRPRMSGAAPARPLTSQQRCQDYQAPPTVHGITARPVIAARAGESRSARVESEWSSGSQSEGGIIK